MLIFAVSLLVLPLNIPLPFIERLSLWHLFAVVLFVTFLADTAIRKSPFLLQPDIFSKCLLIVAWLIVIRVIYDRPGSTRFGGSGGLGEAVIFVIGILSFFPLRWMTAHMDVSAKDNIAILTMAFLGVVLFLIRNGISDEPFYMGVFYHSQMWMVAAFFLSILAASARIQRSAIPWFTLFVFFFMVLAAITPHRSRPLFAVTNALLIGYLFSRFRKTFALVLVAGVIGFSALLAVGRGELPAVVQGSLTIVQSIFGQESLQSRTRGVSDAFRGFMYRYGWERIKEHPFIGKGFTFTSAEMIASFSYIDVDSTTGIKFEGIAALALAGGYHNAVFELMVFCGIPVTILFVVAYFGIFVQFLKWCKSLPNLPLKIFAAGLSGYFVQASGQMLMNGSGAMFGQICLILGVMSGLMIAEANKPSQCERFA